MTTGPNLAASGDALPGGGGAGVWITQAHAAGRISFVDLAARVMALGGAGDVFVSSTIRDLVAGSGLRFADAGRHRLKGVEGEWALYRAA